ncbi:MAG TPA: hypothetical protein DCM61_05155 [Clostridiales bacterium]|nr:hypothetical protein [Clostridiales bacterium]
MKKRLSLLLACTLCLCFFTGCGDIEIGSAPTPAPLPVSETETPAAEEIKGGGVSVITLTGSSAEVSGGGVSIDGSVVTIASPGEYSVLGNLNNGCIVVNTGEVKGDVSLTLDNCSITCLDGPAIRVEQAKNFDLILGDGTENRLVSGTAESAPVTKLEGAALFSEDDLDILGGGSLEISGYLNNGITCKDDLDIMGGTLTVTAVNNGIKGSESVEITGGAISVTAGNDGIKSTSAKKEGKGYVQISDGTITVDAVGDGISAETTMEITGGAISVTTTGDRELISSKGLKANGALTISGGELTLASEDHAIHSTSDLIVSGGTISALSHAGKGLSSHATLTVSGGKIDLKSGDDGVAALSALAISDGEITVLAGADGLKAGNKETASGTIDISGGTITVNAYGDAIDAKTSAAISGGSFVGTGASKQPQGFVGGTQRSVLFSFPGAAESVAQIRDEAGTVIGEIASSFAYTYAIYSAPDLASGSFRLVRGTLEATAAAN